VKDIHEWLAETGVQLPSEFGRAALQIGPTIVTYHESCHLCHGQKITRNRASYWKAIPNVKLVELPESSWCCGSRRGLQSRAAGDGRQLLDRKLKHIRSTGATVVATGQSWLLAATDQWREENRPATGALCIPLRCSPRLIEPHPVHPTERILS